MTKFRLTYRQKNQKIIIPKYFTVEAHDARRAIKGLCQEQLSIYDMMYDSYCEMQYEFRVISGNTKSYYFSVFQEAYHDKDGYIKNDFTITKSKEVFDIPSDRDIIRTDSIVYPDPKFWPPKTLDEYKSKEPLDKSSWKIKT